MSYFTSQFIRLWGQQKDHYDDHHHHNDHHDPHQPSLGYMWVCQARRTGASVQSRSYHRLFFFSNRPLFIIISSSSLIIINVSVIVIIVIIISIIMIEILSLSLLNLLLFLFLFLIQYVGLFGSYSFWDILLCFLEIFFSESGISGSVGNCEIKICTEYLSQEFIWYKELSYCGTDCK